MSDSLEFGDLRPRAKAPGAFRPPESSHYHPGSYKLVGMHAAQSQWTRSAPKHENAPSREREWREGDPGSFSKQTQRRKTGRAGIAAILGIVILMVPGALTASHLVIDETGRQVRLPDRPHRLVSLAPSVTETLYALGLGQELVGDTDYCDYPPEARQKPHVGSLLNPSLEKIVALKPDLVLGTPEANRIETASQLERLGIPLYGLKAASLDEISHMIGDLGRVLGQQAAAESLRANLARRTHAVEARVRGLAPVKVLFVVQYQPLITVGSRTFVADVIRRAGGSLISDNSAGDWPNLSLETVVALDPDVILVPGSSAFTPPLDEFHRMPGWRDLKAVKNRRIYLVSEAIVHPSPRLVDALEQVAGILHPAPSASPAGSPTGGRR